MQPRHVDTEAHIAAVAAGLKKDVRATRATKGPSSTYVSIPEPIYPSLPRREFRVPCGTLAAAIRDCRYPEYPRSSPGLLPMIPPDALLVGGSFDLLQNVFVLVYEHASFTAEAPP